jgi:hypothetical protein
MQRRLESSTYFFAPVTYDGTSCLRVLLTLSMSNTVGLRLRLSFAVSVEEWETVSNPFHLAPFTPSLDLHVLVQKSVYVTLGIVVIGRPCALSRFWPGKSPYFMGWSSWSCLGWCGLHLGCETAMRVNR